MHYYKVEAVTHTVRPQTMCREVVEQYCWTWQLDNEHSKRNKLITDNAHYGAVTTCCIMIPRQWRVHCPDGRAASTDRRVAVSLSPLAPDHSRTALSLATATAWRCSPDTQSMYAGSWVPPSHRIIPQYNTHHDFHFSVVYHQVVWQGWADIRSMFHWFLQATSRQSTL